MYIFSIMCRSRSIFISDTIQLVLSRVMDFFELAPYIKRFIAIFLYISISDVDVINILSYLLEII